MKKREVQINELQKSVQHYKEALQSAQNEQEKAKDSWERLGKEWEEVICKAKRDRATKPRNDKLLAGCRPCRSTRVSLEHRVESQRESSSTLEKRLEEYQSKLERIEMD